MDSKHYLDSTTIRGLIVTLVPTVYSVARLFGLDLPDGSLEDIVNGLASIVTLFGIGVAFIGRVKAEKPLTFSK